MDANQHSCKYMHRNSWTNGGRGQTFWTPLLGRKTNLVPSWRESKVFICFAKLLAALPSESESE